MKRRAIISLASGVSLGAALPVLGQTPTKVFRLGSVIEGKSVDLVPVSKAYADARRALGWEEGRNFVEERLFTEGQMDRIPALFADLAARKVDLIFAVGNRQIAAARAATTTIPIVMLYANNPVESGFVASLVRPGANVTGMAVSGPEIVGKNMQLLRETVPQAKRMFLLIPAPVVGVQADLQEARRVADAMGVECIVQSINSSSELDLAFGRIARDRPEALYVFGAAQQVDRAIKGSPARIIEFARNQRLPAMYGTIAWVNAGGLMTYTSNYDDVPKRVVAFADRILKGAKPADIPVEQPTRFDCVINLKTARAMNLTIPQSVRLQATEVIE